MFNPEYKAGFEVLQEELGLWDAAWVAVPAAVRSLGIHYKAGARASAAARAKARVKERFKLLALMVDRLRKRHGTMKADEIARRILMRGGRVFLRGFTPLRPDEDLVDFARVYKHFERHNVIFDVVEETPRRFEVVVRRCLIYEAFRELRMVNLTRWMCDVACAYFSSYHPRIRYFKDRMIARGDEVCHEIFVWV